MRQHALDGEMGLAGIGRAENGRDTAGGGHFLETSLDALGRPGQGLRRHENEPRLNLRIQRRTKPVRIADQAPIPALFRRRSIHFTTSTWTTLSGRQKHHRRQAGPRVNFTGAAEAHGYQRLTGKRAIPGVPLRICSPSGTEHVRITDLVIFRFCSNGLAQHLVPGWRSSTSGHAAVKDLREWFQPRHLLYVPKWELCFWALRPYATRRKCCKT